MPTPVKNNFPSPSATPARAGTAPVSSDVTGGDAFQNELVRRRRQEAPDKPERAAPARKAEAKRTGKPKATARPARGKQTEKAQESGVATDRVEEPEEHPAAPAGGDLDAPQADDAPAADEAAGAELHEHDASEGAAAVVAGGLLTAPPAKSADAAETPDSDATAEADQPAAGQGSEDLLRARLVAHAADHAGENTNSEKQPADPAPSHAGKGPALFAPDGEDARAAAPASPEKHAAPASPSPATDPAAQVASSAQPVQIPTAAEHLPRTDKGTATEDPSDLAAGLPNARTEPAHVGATPASAAPPPPPEVRFATANHDNIVTSMRAEVLPNGGSMRIRLDPPQLGALQVTVQVRDGLITAAFETSNDEATRLLGHSLNQLKGVLESQGVAVDKLQVQQAPRDANPSGAHDDSRREQGGNRQEQDHQARQEQQRREMLQKMWRRLAGGQDPLDLTA